LGSGIDQRIKADGFLKSLQKFLHSIFEAEDNLSPDTSDRVADKGSKYWMVGSRSPCLATAVQVKLEDAIHKVIMSGRFRDVSVDDLVRIQKLCENSLKQAESIGVMVSADDDDLAIEEWLARISLVDNGLKTAKTVIRIMLGGREEKQIYPEDALASVLNLTKNIIEEAINRIIEMRPMGEEHAVFKVASSYKKILGGLLHEITGLLSLIGEFLASEEVSDHTITTLEFIAAPVIFVENASTEKESVFDVQKVERFRVTAMDVFAQVFARYSDQRTFIFDQILTSLEKLSVNRQSARQFKLAETGKNIQLVSALIIRLVQISGTYQDRRKKRRLILDEDGEVTTEKFDDSNDYKGREVEHIGSVDGLYAMSNSLLDSARKSALYVVNFLVQRAMKSTKSGDQPYRILMDIFTEDLITVLGFPEWPGAELLLQCILGSMFRIVDGDKQTAPAKSMALDLLGLMGSAICDVVTYLRESHKKVVVEGDKRARYLYTLTEDYLSGVSATKIEERLIDWHGPFRYSLEHLLEIVTHSPSLRSAWGYYLTTWSTRVCALSEKLDGENDKESEQVAKEMARTAANLRRTMVDNDWIERDL
jgi:cohesin loading factor subunit SCC2